MIAPRTQLLIACLLITLTGAARADRPAVEVSMGPGVFNATSATASTLMSQADQTLGRLSVGVSLTRWLDLRIGGSYLTSDNNRLLGGVPTTFEMATASVGVKAAYAFVDVPRWTVQFVGQVDVEAVYADVSMQLPDVAAPLEQGIWTLGLHPQAGFEVLFSPDLEADWALVLQVVAGFDWRMDQSFDALSASTVPGVRPVDLGMTNLSGVTMTTTLGVRF